MCIIVIRTNSDVGMYKGAQHVLARVLKLRPNHRKAKGTLSLAPLMLAFGFADHQMLPELNDAANLALG